MSGDESISDWLVGLKDADEAAVQKIWEQYFQRLVGLARKILESSRRQAVDEEDVALSAFDSFCRRAARHEFPTLNDRDDLWKLLMTITAKKACKVRRKEHRPHEKPTPQAPLDIHVASTEPDPQLAAELADEFQHLLGLLHDDRARSVALLKLEGFKNKEIAGKLNRSVATVERKLQLIRRIWSREMGGFAPDPPSGGRGCTSRSRAVTQHRAPKDGPTHSASGTPSQS
jgi:DNA-directed RNA polymerase specialized sigma24 family protein